MSQDRFVDLGVSFLLCYKKKIATQRRFPFRRWTTMRAFSLALDINKVDHSLSDVLTRLTLFSDQSSGDTSHR